jgi:O-antigen ligase
MRCNGRVERVHHSLFLIFVLFLGLFEGPAEIACIAVLISIIASGRLKAWRPEWFEICLLLWALAGLVGLLSTDARISSEDKFRPLLGLAFIVGRYSLGPKPNPQLLRRMAWAFFSACVVNGAYGYLQVGFGRLPWDELMLRKMGSPQIFVPGHYARIHVASGLFYNRLKLAHVGIVALGGMLLLISACPPRQWRKSHWVLLFGACILAPALVLTHARMAIAAFLAALTVMVLILAQRKIVIGFLVSTSIAVLSFLSSDIAASQFQRLSGDLKIRANIYKMAMTIISEHPWLGVGHGVYRSVANEFFQEGWSRTWLVDTHQLILHTWAETGIIGLVAFMTVLLMGLIRLTQRCRVIESPHSPDAQLDHCALFGLLALSFLGMVHYPLHHAPVALLFWFCLGLAYRKTEKHNA